MKKRRFVAVMVGVMVLTAGLMLMSVNRGAQAKPPADNPGNPFQAILDKLDQVLAAITGVQEGNHTLRWDTNNLSATRFTTVFPGAVLDKNTGLVWEQAPDATAQTFWGAATSYCVNKEVGNTAGWRLPSVVELKSLQDASPGAVAPFVPVSVFTGVQTGVTALYWSATTFAPTFADFSNTAWSVDFFNGNVNGSLKSNSFYVWCVRGGMNADAY